MEKPRRSTDSDKVLWLANQISNAYPREVTGLKLYILDCGCVYYQRVARSGELDPRAGIYRNAEDGLCRICISQEEAWGDRVSNEVVVYNSKFKIDFGR